MVDPSTSTDGFEPPPQDMQPDPVEPEFVTTSAADVESAGRSCLIIIVLATLAILLICFWIGIRATGGGQ